VADDISALDDRFLPLEFLSGPSPPLPAQLPVSAGIVAGMVASPPPMGPERSRNAKAQARHRAKRKAYISHLGLSFIRLAIQATHHSIEHSVSRLTTLVGVDAPSDLAQHPLTRLKALEGVSGDRIYD
jgi:hypothetical protein